MEEGSGEDWEVSVCVRFSVNNRRMGVQIVIQISLPTTITLDAFKLVQ